jgi:hypothetical protein
MADEPHIDAPPVDTGTAPALQRRGQGARPVVYEGEPVALKGRTRIGDRIAHIARVLIGLALIAALAVIISQLRATLHNAPSDISAIQVIQVYTEALFQAVVAIGLGVAGYVVTRAAG